GGRSTAGSARWRQDTTILLLRVLVAFLRLGLTSLGGPIAHLGYLREEFRRAPQVAGGSRLCGPGGALSVHPRAGQQQDRHRHRSGQSGPARRHRGLDRLYPAFRRDTAAVCLWRGELRRRHGGRLAARSEGGGGGGGGGRTSR